MDLASPFVQRVDLCFTIGFTSGTVLANNKKVGNIELVEAKREVREDAGNAIPIEKHVGMSNSSVILKITAPNGFGIAIFYQTESLLLLRLRYYGSD